MSKIEWTNETWNSIIGCTKVSPGCTNCYAEKTALRLSGIRATEDSYCEVINFNMKDFGKWNGKTHFQESQLEKPLKWKKPRMIFVCSMGDLFHESVPFEWIDRVFSITQKCPQHTFQILTKRPEIMLNYFESRGVKNPYLNVWLGVTAENQEMANKRIPILLQISAKVHFVSVEPMLSEIDISKYLKVINENGWEDYGGPFAGRDKLDWIICGGESGHNARPMNPEWIRNLKDQCETANVPFYFKQWGEWLPWEYTQPPLIESQNGQSIDSHGIEIYNPYTSELNKGWFHDLENGMVWQKVGKKVAGCKLDGKEYKQFPKI